MSEGAAGYLAQGEKVALRPLLSSDVNDRYLGWMNDSEVTRYLDSHGPYVLEDLKDYYSKHAATDSSMMFAIVDRRTDQHVGNLKLEPIDRCLRTAVLGVLIGDKSYWSKGICSEAVRLIIQHAFDQLGMRKIELGVRVEHSAAIRCYERAGLRAAVKGPVGESHTANDTAILWMAVIRDKQFVNHSLP